MRSVSKIQVLWHDSRTKRDASSVGGTTSPIMPHPFPSSASKGPQDRYEMMTIWLLPGEYLLGAGIVFPPHDELTFGAELTEDGTKDNSAVGGVDHLVYQPALRGRPRIQVQVLVFQLTVRTSAWLETSIQDLHRTRRHHNRHLCPGPGEAHVVPHPTGV